MTTTGTSQSHEAHFFRFRDFFDPKSKKLIARCTISVKRTFDLYEVGFAFCSDKDARNYTRALGRRIADGRRAVWPVRLTAEDISASEGVLNAALKELAKLDCRPEWVPQKAWNSLNEQVEKHVATGALPV